MAAIRRAEATWTGDLPHGRGTVTAVDDRRLRATCRRPGRRGPASRPASTSPEELLAAAHASCFSMACSNDLAKAGTPPSG